MYRAVAFAALRRGIDPADAEPVGRPGRRRSTSTSTDGVVLVDGVDATIEIRGPEVTRAVSARSPPTRRARRAACAASGSGPASAAGGVIEGRDIGTVVFPDAALKVYLTARPRSGPGAGQGGHRPRLRDRRRRHRPPRRLRPGPGRSPLRQADDALVIDTTDLTIDEIVDELVERVDDGETRGSRRSAPPADPSGAVAALPPRPRRRVSRWGGGRPPGRPPLERGCTGDPGPVPRLLQAVVPVAGAKAPNGCRRTVPHIWPPSTSPTSTSSWSRRSPPRMRYLGKDSIWRYPTLGPLLSAVGGIPVHRGTADREALRTCVRAVEPVSRWSSSRRGPPGRSDGDDLFDGPTYVAARTGVPIVPIGIGGWPRRCRSAPVHQAPQDHAGGDRQADPPAPRATAPAGSSGEWSGS